MNTNRRELKTPELRFSEFTGEWVEKRLEHGITLVSGQHLSPSEYNNESFGMPYFTGPSDFTNDESQCTKWTENTRHTGRKDDVLITVKGNGVGKLLFLELGEVAMGRQLMAVRSNGYYTQFIFYTLLIRDRLFQSLAAGNLIPGLSRKDILSAKIAVPDSAEQKRIASFLSAVDGRMEGLEKKGALLRDYKKGLMQKLFNQSLRFKDDQGNPFPDWEEKRLEKGITLVSGQHLGPDAYNSRKHGVPYFTGPSDFTNDLSQCAKWTENTRHMGRKGDVLITVKGSGVGALLYLELDEVAMGRQLMAIRSNGFSALFIFFILLMRHRTFQSLAAGNLIPGLARRDILQQKVFMPSLAEQRKIADCLSAVDWRIGVVEAQVAQTRAFKQGLLQQMFV